MNLIDGNAQIVLLNETGANGPAKNWAGGRGSLFVSGTFGGATVGLSWSPSEAGTFRDCGESCRLTAAGAINIELPPGWVKATITGGAGVSVTSELTRIPQ